MSGCGFLDAGTIELCFYGELEPAAAERVDAHVRACAVCQRHLEDLRAIRTALASRPRVDGPARGDWTSFTRRLDTAIASPATSQRMRTVVPWLAIAATLTVVTTGVLVTTRVHHEQPSAAREESSMPASLAAAEPPTVPQTAASAIAPDTAVVRDANRSLVQHSEEHFERSKLVVLGLATLDPQQARAGDWQHERQLAGSLLPDTRLYRLAAEQRGMTNLARVLGDLETVLLETSMADHPDAEALERVQRLIARRDLVVKMNVVGSGI
ncbi:MAG TPA: hypothetical protein VL484_01085 [Vicinamibacterales bacterium]|nr:hypothetical protein [Vicinamibacterales bacterium]